MDGSLKWFLETSFNFFLTFFQNFMEDKKQRAAFTIHLESSLDLSDENQILANRKTGEELCLQTDKLHKVLTVTRRLKTKK